MLNCLQGEPEYSEQGLDQVPTRLNSRTRTRSSTPNKGIT